MFQEDIPQYTLRSFLTLFFGPLSKENIWNNKKYIPSDFSKDTCTGVSRSTAPQRKSTETVEQFSS